MLSLTGPRDLRQLGDFHGRNGLQDNNKRSSSPEKTATCNRPPNQRPGAKRDQRGESWHTVSRNPIIQIIQSVCHYDSDMRHTQSKLLNLPSNLLSELCKYCLSVLLHLMKLQFLQKLWLFYSEFFANSLRFQRLSSSCEYIKSKSNKIRLPGNTSTKKEYR